MEEGLLNGIQGGLEVSRTARPSAGLMIRAAAPSSACDVQWKSSRFAHAHITHTHLGRASTIFCFLTSEPVIAESEVYACRLA